MTTTVKNRLNYLLVIFLLPITQLTIAAELTDDFGPQVQPGQTLQSSDMTTLRPQIPKDIYRRYNRVEPADLATFAWLEFIALNAPAGLGERGRAKGSFAGAARHPGKTVVWETFSHRSELYPKSHKAIAPQPWNSLPTYSFNHSVDHRAVNFRLFNNLDQTSASDPNVRLESKVNAVKWQYINDNYQNLSGHKSKYRLQYPSNSIEINAAWQPLSTIPTDQHYRYHTTEAIYYQGSSNTIEAKNGQFALISLDIKHKTTNYPSYIFATFSHRDLASQSVPPVTAVNQQAIQAMKDIPGFDDKFVWQYYQLQGVQAVPGDVRAATAPLHHAPSDATQQPVLDPATPKQPIPAGSCMGCHATAQQQGFDFSFLHQGKGGKGFAVQLPQIIKPAIKKAHTVQWQAIPHSAQLGSTSWQGLIARKHNITLAQAKAFAAENDKIDFFFWVDGKGFRLSKQGRFEANEAVFFSGKPIVGKVVDTHVYVKK